MFIENKLNFEEIFEIEQNILKFYIELLNQINCRFDFKREDIKLLQIITYIHNWPIQRISQDY